MYQDLQQNYQQQQQQKKNINKIINFIHDFYLTGNYKHFFFLLDFHLLGPFSEQ